MPDNHIGTAADASATAANAVKSDTRPSEIYVHTADRRHCIFTGAQSGDPVERGSIVGEVIHISEDQSNGAGHLELSLSTTERVLTGHTVDILLPNQEQMTTLEGDESKQKLDMQLATDQDKHVELVAGGISTVRPLGRDFDGCLGLEADGVGVTHVSTGSFTESIDDGSSVSYSAMVDNSMVDSVDVMGKPASLLTEHSPLAENTDITCSVTCLELGSKVVSSTGDMASLTTTATVAPITTDQPTAPSTSSASDTEPQYAASTSATEDADRQMAASTSATLGSNLADTTVSSGLPTGSDLELDSAVWSEISGVCTALRLVCVQLSLLCQQNPAAAAQLRQLQLPLKLLRSMRLLLSVRLPKAEAVVRACAELVIAAHMECISASELSAYLALLTAPDPPALALLEPLGRLFESPPAPVHYLLFSASELPHQPRPADAQSEPTQQTDESEPRLPTDATTAEVLHTQRSHRQRRVGSALALAAGCVPLGSPRRPVDPFAGCSASVWLWFSAASRADVCGAAASAADSSLAAAEVSADVKRSTAAAPGWHLASVGAAGCLLELWLDADAGVLVLRRTDNALGVCRPLKEVKLSAQLEQGRWTHVALRLVPCGDLMTLTVFVDGSDWQSADVPAATCSAGAVLLLGDGGASGVGDAQLQLTSVLVFSEPVLDMEHALLLHMLGPDCASLTSCTFTPHKVSLTGRLTPDVVRGANVGRISSSFSDMLRRMEGALLLSLDGRSLQARCYPEPGGAGVPSGVPVTWRAAPRCVVRPRLSTALCQLGGLRPLLYLLARVVELGGDDVTQAAALQTLLAAAAAQWRWSNDEPENLLPHMIASVLGSKLSSSGVHTLRVYLCACVSGLSVPVRGARCLAGPALSTPLLRNPSLLVALFRHWRCWLRPQPDRFLLLTEAVRVLCAVLEPHQPLQGFNIAVLREKRLPQELLQLATAFYTEDAAGCLPAALVAGLIRLVRNFASTSPGVGYIELLWNTVLLLHPTRSLYVSQTRSSCYFLLDSALMHGRSRSKSARRRASPTATASPQPAASPDSEISPDSSDRCLSTPDRTAAVTSATDGGAPPLTNVACDKHELVSKFLDSIAASAGSDAPSPERRGSAASDLPTPERAVSADTLAAVAAPPPPPTVLMPPGSQLQRAPVNEPPTAEVTCGQFAARLIGLVSSCLQQLSAAQLPAACRQVSAQHFTVLANHPEPAVRAAVIQLLLVWWERAPAADVRQFARNCGFHQLGCQLAAQPASASVTAAVGRLLLPARASALQAGALTLLLTLLPASVDDADVCAAILATLTHIVTRVDGWVTPLLDDGLVESVCAASLRLAHRSADGALGQATAPQQAGAAPDRGGVGGVGAGIQGEISRLLAALARRLVLAAQPKPFQVLLDVCAVLNFLHEQERRHCGPASTAALTAAALHLDMLEAALNALIEKTEVAWAASAPAPRLSQWELAERHRRLVLWTVDFLSFLDGASVSEHTDALLRWLLPMLAVCVQAPLVADAGPVDRLRSSRHTLKTALGTLLVTLLSPDWPMRVRLLVVSFLAQMDSGLDSLLQATLMGESSKAYQFSVFFHELASTCQRSQKADAGSVVTSDSEREVTTDDGCPTPAAAVRRARPGRTTDSADDALLSPEEGYSALSTAGGCSDRSDAELVSHSDVTASMSDLTLTQSEVTMSSSSDVTVTRGSEVRTSPGGGAATESVSWSFGAGGEDRCRSTSVGSHHQAALTGVAEALQRCGLKPPAATHQQKQSSGGSPEQKTLQLWRESRAARYKQWRGSIASTERRATHCFESYYHQVCEAAHNATETTAARQNEARRTQMQLLRAAAMLDARVDTAWKQLAMEMADERAPWAPPDASDGFWELDPTEGWLRQRIRLRKTKLNLASRFFKTEKRAALESDRLPTPLSYLLVDNTSDVSSHYIEQFHTDTVRYMTPCEVIVLDGGVAGEILISDSSLYFVVDRRAAQPAAASMVLGPGAGYQQWPCDSLREVHRRRYELRECAVELFFSMGRTYLITFNTTEVRERFLSELFKCSSLQLNDGETLTDVTQAWRDGTMTSFEYLMVLNKMAGRSFNDLMQYPVFPFVLKDYSSETLDLTEPEVFRDLRRPMGVQDPSREAYYRNRYQYLQSELLGPGERLGIDGPYHYGTHYSNSGIVLHFLLRLPPFTHLFLKFQDGNFDLADRSFHAVEQAWRLASSASNTDFKELIPEFYYLHELFTNSQGFAMGARQSGQPVDRVRLPGWCHHSARLFVLVLRQALESELVRAALPHWIDLVFGYKQTGPAAVQALNVFHPATYVGYDVDRCEDEMARLARLTMVRTYGQMPRRLFRSPHPHAADAPHAPPAPPTQLASELLPSVCGVRWGVYVGSPECAAAGVLWQRPLTAPVAALGVAPAGGLLLTVPPHTCCTHTWRQLSRNAVLSAPATEQLTWVNWGQPDGLLRHGSCHGARAEPIAAPPPGDQVGFCAFVAGRLWVALLSGAVHVYTISGSGGSGGEARGRGRRLVRLGLGRPAALLTCASFSLVVGADVDGNIALWDSNTAALVRWLRVEGDIRSVAVSATCADLVVAHQTRHLPAGAPTTLQLITVNGHTAACRTAHAQVTALALTSLTEGAAVNVVAAGDAAGAVSLWDTWLLRPVGAPLQPTAAAVGRPVHSLCYTQSGQLLHVLHGCPATSHQLLVLWTVGGVRPARSAAARVIDLAAELPRSLPAWSVARQHLQR